MSTPVPLLSSGPSWPFSSVNFTSFHLYYVLPLFVKCTFDIVDMTTIGIQVTVPKELTFLLYVQNYRHCVFE
jgi:hypothetical protein